MHYGDEKGGGLTRRQFVGGAAALVGAALVVGMAKGIVIVLGGTEATDPSVMNTILYMLGNLLSNVPGVLSAWLMYVFQSLFNFVVVSGSGQAAVVMPIMAPLADLLNITRDTAVLAFQFGDGLSNILWPTASTAIICGMAGVKIDKWWKFCVPCFLALFATQAVLMVVAVVTGFGA